MRSNQRLAAADDFRLLFSRGKRVESPLFRLLWRTNGLALSRFAFVVSKAVAKRAVVRNRISRRAREWYRKRPELFHAPVDLVVLFQKAVVGATRALLYAELERCTAELIRRG